MLHELHNVYYHPILIFVLASIKMSVPAVIRSIYRTSVDLCCSYLAHVHTRKRLANIPKSIVAVVHQMLKIDRWSESKRERERERENEKEESI